MPRYAKNLVNMNNPARIEHGFFEASYTAKITSQWHIHNERPRESKYLHVPEFGKLSLGRKTNL